MLGTLTLLAATAATALLAGTFYAFDVAVVPGLARADPRGAVGTMQSINVAIVNPWFMLSFLGSPALIAVTLLVRVLEGAPGLTVAGTAVALGLVVVALALTARLHIPLNDTLAAAGSPEALTDPADVLGRYLRPWARWNRARTLSTLAATVVLVASS